MAAVERPFHRLSTAAASSCRGCLSRVCRACSRGVLGGRRPNPVRSNAAAVKPGSIAEHLAAEPCFGPAASRAGVGRAPARAGVSATVRSSSASTRSTSRFQRLTTPIPRQARRRRREPGWKCSSTMRPSRPLRFLRSATRIMSRTASRSAGVRSGFLSGRQAPSTKSHDSSSTPESRSISSVTGRGAVASGARELHPVDERDELGFRQLLEAAAERS